MNLFLLPVIIFVSLQTFPVFARKTKQTVPYYRAPVCGTYEVAKSAGTCSHKDCANRLVTRPNVSFATCCECIEGYLFNGVECVVIDDCTGESHDENVES